ncbi:MAG: c-type cytochrome [Acidobacteriota bacterium]|nr:c-type cytochrome [Acidobacteriota bacterium]
MTKPILRAAVFCLAFLASVPAPAQDDWRWPERMKNPKAFPKDFPASKLAAVMKGFTRALGVRCPYCHVGQEGKPLGTFDFASDQNPNKDRAREMYRMLGDINDHLKKITPSGDKPVNMWCHTCHQARPRPVTLEEDLGEAYRESGAAFAVKRYRDLRERFYGRAGYDFGERSLASFGGELLEKGDAAAAIVVFDLNAELFPRSAKAWENLADACGAAGKKELAAFYYRKSAEIDPANTAAAEKLRASEAK